MSNVTEIHKGYAEDLLPIYVFDYIHLVQDKNKLPAVDKLNTAKQCISIADIPVNVDAVKERVKEAANSVLASIPEESFKSLQESRKLYLFMDMETMGLDPSARVLEVSCRLAFWDKNSESFFMLAGTHVLSEMFLIVKKMTSDIQWCLDTFVNNELFKDQSDYGVPMSNVKDTLVVFLMIAKHICLELDDILKTPLVGEPDKKTEVYMAGSSVYFDHTRLFLNVQDVNEHLPQLHHRLLDATSFMLAHELLGNHNAKLNDDQLDAVKEAVVEFIANTTEATSAIDHRTEYDTICSMAKMTHHLRKLSNHVAAEAVPQGL